MKNIVKDSNGIFTVEDDEIETMVEDTVDTMMIGYVIGIFATVMSIISVIINYNFYGKLYEHFHKKD